LTVWFARTNSLWTILSMSKKMMSMLLTLLFTCLVFWVSVSLAHACFPKGLSNHCQSIRRSFPEIWTTFNVVSLLDPSRNLIRPDIRYQIKGCKNQHIHPAAGNFVHWLPRYASIITYRYIALLQLLCRWQH
jgi:hypothetical protein